MAIFATLFAFLGRQLQRILTTVLGWASTLLFGRVPADRQVVLVLVTFGSIGWLALLLGVLFPDLGAVLLAFVPVPDVVPEWVIRLAMLVAAIVLPPVLGGATLLLMPAGSRPTGVGLLVQVLRGYPLAAFVALSLGVLAVIAVWYKARALVRRRSTAHVPIIVQPGGYDRVVRELEQALDSAGLPVDERLAPAALAVPARLLGRVAGGGIGTLVPERLVQLTTRDLEVTVYPTDVALTAPSPVLARARAAIATRLASAPAYLTTTAETQAVEDRIEQLAADARSGQLEPDRARRELAAIDAALATLDVAYDEWEVLYRMRLQAERDLLAGVVPGTASPGAGAAGRTAMFGEGARRTEPAERGAPISVVVGAVASLLLLLDAALLVWERLSPPRGRARHRK